MRENERKEKICSKCDMKNGENEKTAYLHF